MKAIKKIQLWMEKNNIDYFLVNRTDQFLNEYISSSDERLKWLSNFSGSAGRAIIKKREAYIFVDGRYTEQANEQINKKYFKIKHLNDYWNYLKTHIYKSKILSLDPKLHSINEINKIKKILKNKQAQFQLLDSNPIDLSWKDQPNIPHTLAFNHLDKYSGKKASLKIKKIKSILKPTSIDYYLLCSLESIAWLLNIRGCDIQYTPLLFCYAIIPRRGKIELFVDPNKVKPVYKTIKNLVNIHPINEVEKFINLLDNKKIFGLDENETTYFFKHICIKNKMITVNFINPCIANKAKKNLTEINGAKDANIRDGVSVTKFLFWLKMKIEINKMDEIKAANYLYDLRKKNHLFFSLSFDTISAFGSNAALPHYRVTNRSNLSFKKNSIYLVDSGAQYKDGTTDITRTIILGQPSAEHKERFTRVLKGHIAVANHKFSHNTKGSQIDPLARKYLKEINCNYDHGTGHGIGSFSSVHEGPQRIAKSINNSDNVIEKGMITSNEPGFYKKNEYGIRIENLLVCCSQKNDLLYFETISWAPIDRDLIERLLLNNTEIKWINGYHNKVYKKISPYLVSSEKKWLYNVTRPI